MLVCLHRVSVAMQHVTHVPLLVLLALPVPTDFSTSHLVCSNVRSDFMAILISCHVCRVLEAVNLVLARALRSVDHVRMETTCLAQLAAKLALWALIPMRF